MSKLESLYRTTLPEALDKPQEEADAIYKEFREAALEDPDGLVSLLHSVDPLSENFLWDVYASLRDDAGRWKDLLVSEAARLIEAAVKHPDNATRILGPLEGVSAAKDAGYLKAIKKELAKHLKSPVLGVRRRVVWEYCVCSDDYDASEIAMLQDILLTDSDWRIRNFCRECLLETNDLPNHYSEPLLDLIRRKTLNRHQW